MTSGLVAHPRFFFCNDIMWLQEGFSRSGHEATGAEHFVRWTPPWLIGPWQTLSVALAPSPRGAPSPRCSSANLTRQTERAPWRRCWNEGRHRHAPHGRLAIWHALGVVQKSKGILFIMLATQSMIGAAPAPHVETSPRLGFSAAL